MSADDRIKVLILHRDPVARAGLSATFNKYADLDVRDTTDELDAMPPETGPTSRWQDHVVVTDYSQGVALAVQGGRSPNRGSWPKIVIVAGNDLECEIRTALQRGVHGYLLVGCGLDELVAGVRAVFRGARHLSPQVAARLAESISVEALTAREEQVLRLVVDGLCNKAIGRRLGIAVGTVKSHLKSTFDKLSVESRTQAAAAVKRRGLLRDMTALPVAEERHGFARPALWRVSGSAGHRHAEAAL